MGGHAIVYEVIRETEKTYAFRVYNRGDGTEYHEEFTQGKKSMILPFTEIDGIVKKNLLSPIFLQKLQALQIKEPPRPMEKWPASMLYTMILPLLDGEMSHMHFDLGQAQEPQTIGHCAYMSWAALLHEHMGKHGNYERLEYEIQFKTLRDYFLENESRLTDQGIAAKLYKGLLRFALSAIQYLNVETEIIPQKIMPQLSRFFIDELAFENEGARHLVQKGLADFARNAEDLFLKGGISQKEAAYTTEWIQRIQTTLNEAEERYRTETMAKPPLIDALQAPSRKIFKVIRYENGELLPSEGKNISWIPPLAIPPFCQATLPSDLADFAVKLRETNVKENYLDAFMGIQDFVKAIPIDWMSQTDLESEKFWSFLSKEEAEETLAQLVNLSKEYYFSIIKDPRLTSRFSPADYLTQIKLLALGDAISRHRIGIKLPQNLYQSEFDYILKGESVSNSLFDPLWGLQIENLRTYFSRIPSTNDFFTKEAPKTQGSQHGGSSVFLRYIPIQWDKVRDPLDGLAGYYRQFTRPEDTLPNESENDIQWIRVRLQDPKVESDVKRLFPEISSKSSMDQAMFFAYTDSKKAREILGHPFYELRDLSVLSNAMLLMRSSKEMAFMDPVYRDLSEIIASDSADFDKGIVHQVHFFPMSSGASWPPYDWWLEEVTIFGIENGEYPTDSRFNDLLLQASDSLSLNALFEKKGEVDPLYSDLSQIFQNQWEKTRMRIPPHSRMKWIKQLPLRALNFQDVRDLSALSSIQGLQIQEAFGYFKERPRSLEGSKLSKFFPKIDLRTGAFSQRAL